MTDAGVESLQRLTRQRTSAAVVDGNRNHYRDFAMQTLVQMLYGIERRLRVQRIIAGFQKQQVGTTLQ